MCDQHEMSTAVVSPQHSTLELAKQDSTAGAPERDHASTAPEKRRDHEALQASSYIGPELALGDSVLEAVPTSEKTRSIRDIDRRSNNRLGVSPRLIIILIATAIAAVIGVAIGTGVGLGLRKKSSTANSSPAPTSTVTRTTAASPTSLGPPLSGPNRILDDTSVSALTLPNGDRRFFFQDFSGFVRQAFYSSATGQWRADTGIIVASDAKNHTPLAAINVPTTANNMSDPSSNIPSIPGGISIFYIRNNNSLACSQFDSGAWSAVGSDGLYFTYISKFNAAAASRQLSVTILPGKPVRLLNAILVYESDQGNIVMLNGSLNVPPSRTDFPFWSWMDASNKLHASIQKSDLQFSAPFTVDHQEVILFAAKNSHGSQSGEALYTDLTGHNKRSIVVNTTWDNGSQSSRELNSPLSDVDSGLNTYNLTEAFDPSFIQKSDILAISLGDSLSAVTISEDYGFWVNGTQLAAFSLRPSTSKPTPLAAIPRTRFPFTRFTGFSPDNSSKIFLYHQLNASIFAEDQWDASVGAWLSGSIEIATT